MTEKMQNESDVFDDIFEEFLKRRLEAMEYTRIEPPSEATVVRCPFCQCRHFKPCQIPNDMLNLRCSSCSLQFGLSVKNDQTEKYNPLGGPLCQKTKLLQLKSWKEGEHSILGLNSIEIIDPLMPQGKGYLADDFSYPTPYYDVTDRAREKMQKSLDEAEERT